MTDAETTITILAPEQLRDLRSRMLKGYVPSDEEISIVLTTLRADRAKIGTSSKKKAAPRKPLDLGSLFS